VKVYECYEYNQEYFIVQEIITGGTLSEYLSRYGGENYEKTICVIIKQILIGLNYCHKQKVWHRDLKLENIMIQEDKNGNPQAKLIDFGLSREVEQKARNAMLASRLGTPQYQAPEVYQGKYSELCDLWSLGILAYILVTQDVPFRGTTNAEI